MSNRCIALLLVLSTLAGLSAAQIHVDDDAPGDPLPFDRQVSDPAEDGSAEHPFDGVQEAIDAAEAGDTIVVAPGHYLSPDPWEYDEIHFKGKNIRLVSSAPTDFRVVEQTVLCGVVIFQGIESSYCLLQGFKIQNHGHGGILGKKTQATISHCIISGNGPCGATVIKDVHGRISNCLIADNSSFHDCGVLPVILGCRELVNCTIANNISGVGLSNYGPPAIRSILIRHCILYGNEGPQLVNQLNRSVETTAQIEFSLIQDWDTTWTTLADSLSSLTYEAIFDSDPCFVRLGQWVTVTEPSSTTSARRSPGETEGYISIAAEGEILIEGDYRLQSEGWRWSPEPLHGSHWYYDESTSPAIDAGDPTEGLGEELERAPDDLAGQFGFNHALDLGVYGGTTQASLAPTGDEIPGVGAVDLRDFWDLGSGSQWYLYDPAGGTIREVRWTTGSVIRGYQVYPLWISSAPGWAATVYFFYIERTLYMTQYAAGLSRLPEISSQFNPMYPKYPVIGSTMPVPYNPFLAGTPEYRFAVLVRGTLDEVLAGSYLGPDDLLPGSWPDVIAWREQTPDGAPGRPIAIFARGVGPLMIAGQPVVQTRRTTTTTPARR